MDSSPHGSDMPSALAADIPADESWGEAWEGPTTDLNALQHQHMTAVTSLSASQATSAAWHADIAAKQAASLAQWVQYLWNQVTTLQKRVMELEDWKKNTLDEMSKLRFEHKNLRRKAFPDGEADNAPPLPKAKSVPVLIADTVESGTTSPTGMPVAKRKANKAQTESVLKLKGMGPPPGLEDSLDAREAENDDGNLEGVQVELLEVDGRTCMTAEWRIGHLSVKLRNCMGRALVSPPFKAWGLEDLRLMIFADGRDDASTGPRSKRQKDQYSKKVTEGPLDGCIKLKVPDCPPPHLLEYCLRIGSVRRGPFSHNFSENTINGCSEFGIDWLKQVDVDQSLKVTVEIFETQACRPSPE
eukprot:TRINITY_DN75298_c0_g1_i1.p1 TRINITY_DN75298_c0_g1~~TRINITY_DN75298_c0_g1_i1.p1  ORF type:complete len:358 (-),score=74.78 TRINITY_DN75298_c0_g1_i1:247-1320(-)